MRVSECTRAEHAASQAFVQVLRQIPDPRQRVTGHKLNSELVEWLQTHPYLENEGYYRTNSVAYRATAKKLHDRVDNKKIDELVTAFKAGVTQRVLADRYDISVSSVKRLLKERGVKRKSRWAKAA